jgi:tetratricopeptide (TPR) repeat protein
MIMLSKAALYLCVVIFAGLTSAQTMNPEAGKLYTAGNELLKTENYAGAIESYNKALEIEKDYRIYYQKGVAQKKSDDLKGAKTSFEEVVKLKPDFEAGYNSLGGVDFALGDYPGAIENFEKLLTITEKEETKKAVQTNLSLAYTRAGDAAVKEGNSAQAIQYLVRATELNNYDAAYLNLAKLYVEAGDNDKAIAAAESALKYKTKIKEGGPYYYMGLAYKNKGDVAKAKEMFNKALPDQAYRKNVEYELSALK